MAIYHYTAIDRSGQPVQGEIEAPDEAAATSALSEQGRFVTRIGLRPSDRLSIVGGYAGSGNNVVSGNGDSGGKITDGIGGGNGGGTRGAGLGGGEVLLGGSRSTRKKLRLSDVERTEFISQFATALTAQLPLLVALEVVGRQNPHPKVKQLAGELADTVRAGQSLSYGFSRYPRCFDKLHLSMVTVGEATGNLGKTMQQLTAINERELETHNNIMTASLYPAFVLCLGLISMVIVVTIILPQIIASLGDTAVLPWPTRVILVVSNFFRSSGGILLAVFLAGGISLFMLWKKTAAGSLIWDGIKLHIPILASVQRKWAVARFTRTLGTLVEGGVGILDALNIVRNCLGNEVLARELDKITAQVRSGATLANALHKSGSFPPLLVQIVSVGEQTGRLAQLLLRAADSLDKEMNEAVKRFMTVFPAVLITILALLVGLIVAATLLPIVQIETAVPGMTG